ncbi:DNA cytosine methyltransferase [Streptomyces sp. NPDC048342]|uniref:DNA cytosine methyltransferase n=1 Tax=unclassified Streptomyces TaxID=2593676 RepID=UPI0034127EE4
MTAPRIGSVCTGYGGLDIAVQAVFGGSLAWVADNDPGAARILAHHYPEVPNLGDITALDWHDVEPVDILTGGYPCQPFSTAGKRKGTKDARHIWPHIARALGVLRPRYAFFENVAGHLSLGFDAVLADLARLGFDAEWCTVRASDVGGAHQRKRLFVLARLADPEGEGRQGQGLPGRTSGHGLPAADAVDFGGDRSGQAGREPQRHAEGKGRPAAHPARVGEREPADQTEPFAGSRDARQEPGRRGGIAAADADRGRLERDPEPSAGRVAVRQRVRQDTDGRNVAPADAQGDGRDQGRTEPARQQRGSDAAVGSAPDWGEYEPAIRRWETVIGRPAPGPTDALGRLNPQFVEWLMALDDGHVTAVPGLSRTAQLKALGNGVVWPQAVAALRILLSRYESDAWGRAA